jgi:large subunit ribosomal protein L20
MARVKRGTTQRRRHNKVLKAAKGFRGLRNRLFRQAKNAVMKAGMHAYAHRRTKKRDFRRLWIARISAACKANGTNYSRFINALADKKIALDRKVLSDIAIHEPEVFAEIVKSTKK